MVRRLLIVSFVLAASGVAGASACGFPDVAFSETEGSVGDDGSSSDGPGTTMNDGGRDVASDTKANEDAGEILIDGSSPDALIVKDAGAAIDAAGCQPSDCDCDKDTFKETLKAGCNTGTPDCDDEDSRSHPGQGFLVDTPKPGHLGDWNCDGTPEPLYMTNFTCAGLTLGLGCANHFGFTDAPGCGQNGSFVRCRGSLLELACSIDESTRVTTKQACK